MTRVILAHFYDASIPQITCKIDANFTVLQLRQYIIQTYNSEATPEDIELWIAPNEDKTTISQEDNHTSLHKLYASSGDWDWIYWFNMCAFKNKFNKWLFWTNIKHISKNFNHNVSNPMAISFKDLLRSHRTIDYHSTNSYLIPSSNGIFDSKLFTLNSIYKKMIHFIETESLTCKIYGIKFPYSEDTKNIYFCLLFNNKHIIVEDNYDRSLHTIIHGENNEEEKKSSNENNSISREVINVEIYWLNISVVRNKFYYTSKLQFGAIQKYLQYMPKRKYVNVSMLIPSNTNIHRQEYSALFELDNTLTINKVKQCIDKACDWCVRDRIYYIVNGNNVFLLQDENDNDLILKYMTETEHGYKLHIKCMNRNRIFFHQTYNKELQDQKFKELYANIDKTELGKNTYFYVEINNIKTKNSYGDSIWSGRFEFIDDMTVKDIKEHIICSIYQTQEHRDELNLDTSVIFCNGKLLRDEELILNVKRVEDNEYWKLDVLFILKSYYSTVIVPQSYLACIRYSQYVLTSIICSLYNNALNCWPDDLSVIMSLYLYGKDDAWPIINTLKYACTCSPSVDLVDEHVSERKIEVFPYETLGQLKTKIFNSAVDPYHYSTCIRLCSNDENISKKTVYEMGMFDDGIESYFSAKKRLDPAVVDDECLVYMSKTYTIRYKNLDYKRYAISIDCFIFDTLEDVKRKISQITKIDLDEIRLRDSNGELVTNDVQMKRHIKECSRLEQC